jgi:hypothetical protein
MLGSVATVRGNFAAAPLLAIAAGAACLLLPAIINGFPFVFPDSADYLVFTPHIYRSPYYGLFLFLFHVDRFIWAPIIVQALIASHLIWVLMRIYAGEGRRGHFAIAVLMLSLFSSLPFFVGFIMPDFFTGVMILDFYLLAFHLSALSPIERPYFILLGCVAVSAHVSHLPIAFALTIIIIALRLLAGVGLLAGLSAIRALAIPLSLAACAILLNNVVIHRVFSLFPAGQTFLLANMIEQGPASRYLRDACPAAGYRLCAIADALPETSYELLWSTDILRPFGGFTGISEEAREIVAATIRTRPWDVLETMMRSIGSSFLTHAPGAELGPLSNDASMTQVLTRKFDLETLGAYKASMESRGAIPHKFLRRVDSVTFPLAVIGLLATGFFALRRGPPELSSIGPFVLAALVVNNVLCAVGSGVFDRYQARVTWLVALAALLLAGRLLRARDPCPVFVLEKGLAEG